MERNKEKNMAQKTEHPIPTEERSRRADHSRRSTDDNPMFSAECQAEKRNFDIDIPLIYEFKPRTLNERFLCNALKQKRKIKYCKKKKIP